MDHNQVESRKCSPGVDLWTPNARLEMRGTLSSRLQRKSVHVFRIERLLSSRHNPAVVTTGHSAGDIGTSTQKCPSAQW